MTRLSELLSLSESKAIFTIGHSNTDPVNNDPYTQNAKIVTVELNIKQRVYTVTLIANERMSVSWYINDKVKSRIKKVPATLVYPSGEMMQASIVPPFTFQELQSAFDKAKKKEWISIG